MHVAALRGEASVVDEVIVPIARRTLHDEVLTRLRDMIIEGKFSPGQRINEGLVCRQLGVSRTPLREAIKTLMSEGLVDILPARGAIVAAFSERDLRDTLEMLKALEQFAGRAACERAPDEVLKAIEAIHLEMMSLYKERTRLEYFKLNQAIHTAIASASGNGALMRLHASLQARIKRFRFVGNTDPEKWAAAVAEHEQIIAALMARNAEALSEVLGRHLDNAFQRVRYLFDASSAPSM
jgi:DNA-binding GntR family transcriptional regulator